MKPMENKHTAVQWLVEKIQQANPSFKFDALIRQAKQMEKQQIMEAWDKRGSIIVPRYFLEENINGEQYYEQTFKSE